MRRTMKRDLAFPANEGGPVTCGTGQVLEKHLLIVGKHQFLPNCRMARRTLNRRSYVDKSLSITPGRKARSKRPPTGTFGKTPIAQRSSMAA